MEPVWPSGAWSTSLVSCGLIQTGIAAVIFCSLLRPDFLHRLDRFAHPLEAGRIDGPVVFHLVLVPTSADPKQEPSLAHLVDRGHEFGGLDNVALLNEGHAGAEFDSLGHLTGRGQNHERVHGVVIGFGHLASAREGRLARQRDMRVLGHPDRLETALLKRASKLRRWHRIIGKEHRAAEMHTTPPLLPPLLATKVSGWRQLTPSVASAR